MSLAVVKVPRRPPPSRWLATRDAREPRTRSRMSLQQLARRVCTDVPRRSILSASVSEAAVLLGGGTRRASRASEVWTLLRRGESPLDEAAASHLPARTRELVAARVFSPLTHTVSAEATSDCGTNKYGPS